LLLSGPSFAAPSGSTDIQWAQTVLKERGFDPGRADGRATDKTKAALRAFQTASGLPDTGTLDAATTARLMSTRKPPASTGTLRAPAASASSAPAAALANTGSGSTAAVAGSGSGGGGGFSGPRAAPTERVSASGTGSASLLTAAGHRAPMPGLGSRAPSTATATAPAPSPSPSTASPPAPPSTTLSPAARAGQSAEMTEPETKGLSMETRRLLSWGIIGIAGMTLLGFALLWWRSGPQYPWRRRAPAVGARRIPRLTHGASGCLMPGGRGARMAVSH